VEALKAAKPLRPGTGYVMDPILHGCNALCWSALQNFDAAPPLLGSDRCSERSAMRANLLRSWRTPCFRLADIKAKQKQASIVSCLRPQSYSRETFAVPPSALAEFLEKGKVALRLMA